jgi:glycerophosphoryl diester phosphodiesterase
MGRTTSFPAAIATIAALLLAGACSSDRGDDTAASSTTSSTPRPAAGTVAGLLALDRPLVLAHAGGDDVHPHDTPYGFDRSAEAGVDALDMDVQLSADGVLVVQHDDTVDRTTEGSGAVGDMTYDQLHALDAAYWFTEDCTCKDRPDEEYVLRGVRTGEVDPPDGADPEDFAITSFEQIATDHPDHVLNIEIKGEAPEAIPAAQELARLVGELDLTDRVVVTSFDDEVAEAFAAAAPGAAITPGLGATTAYVLQGTTPPAGRTILQVPPDFEGIEVVTAELVERAHRDGLVIWVWPNDARWETAEGYGELLDLGVDGLNAADPATAVEVVRART